jgi:hypothetical protein
MECGHLPEELKHFYDGLHTYAEYQVFGNLSLVLCDFCCADFGSIKPAHFGLPPRSSSLRKPLERLREIYSLPEKSYDYFCPDCHHRLAWLEFVIAARQFHEPNP